MSTDSAAGRLIGRSSVRPPGNQLPLMIGPCQ